MPKPQYANRSDPIPSLPRLGCGIFLLSFGILLLEISLTRIFSYAISYHFAYLTIATALLGFGSAGAILAAVPDWLGTPRRRLVLTSALAGVTSAVALGLSSVVRFNPLEVSTNLSASLTLAGYYLVVSVPFLFAGLAVVTILSARSDRVGRLYGLDLAGAGVGCALSVPLIWLLETPTAVGIGALAIALSGMCYAQKDRALVVTAGLGIAATIVVGTAAASGPFPPSPGKFLSYFLALPGAERLFHQWTPLSRVDAVGFARSENSWRSSYAVSGVGKGFTGRGPEFRMIGYDGGSFAVMYEYDGDPESLDVFRHHLMAAPYSIRESPRTLIIGLGGGADALAALANGAGPITGLELNPVTVRLGRQDFSKFNGNLFDSPALDVEVAEARHWIEAHDEPFDLIVLNSIDTLAALSSGAYVLAESYLYTVEAFEAYLQQLTENGVYALYSYDNFGIAGPTYIIVRFAATLREALQNLGVTDPKRHIAILAAAGDTPFVATLVKMRPFTAVEIAELERFAEVEGFSFWHRPDARVDHQVADYLWMDLAQRREVVGSHYLRFDPATDDSPFFFNFYKWRSMVFPHPDDTGTTPATGQRMLLLMLVQAVVVSAALILWPLVSLARREPVHKPLRFVAYFSALGLGFILLEISLLQRFVLFLGFPTYSLSVVLFCLLLSTGLGSELSARMPVSFRQRPFLLSLVLAVLLLVFAMVAPPIFSRYLSASLPTRIVVAIAMIAPLGLVLGMFFPLGIRITTMLDDRLVPWAWAINAFTTVLGTIAAVMLGMAYGFDLVMATAAVVYCAGSSALSTTRLAA